MSQATIVPDLRNEPAGFAAAPCAEPGHVTHSDGFCLDCDANMDAALGLCEHPHGFSTMYGSGEYAACGHCLLEQTA